MLLWWWIGHTFQLTFSQGVNWQCIILMWYWSWFITGSISPHMVFHLPPVLNCCWWATGHFHAPFPIYRMYQKLLVGSGRVAISPHTSCSSSTFNSMSALEGGDTDKDHVSHPQGLFLAASIIDWFVALQFLPLKQVSLPVNPIHVVPQLFMYLLEVGMVINLQSFQGWHKWEVRVAYSTLIGRGWSPWQSWGCSCMCAPAFQYYLSSQTCAPGAMSTYWLRWSWTSCTDHLFGGGFGLVLSLLVPINL